MKIVYCIPSTFNKGGMERAISAKANCLIKRGYDIYILTTNQRGRTSAFALDKRIRTVDLGINYGSYHNCSLWKRIYHYVRSRNLHKKKLRAFLNQVHADIVISTFNNELSLLPSMQDGSKKMVEFHFSRVVLRDETKTGIYRWIERWVEWTSNRDIRKYCRLVVLNPVEAHEWNFLPNVIHIPNMLTMQNTELSDLEVKRVIAVGRYETVKGFDRLIEIWAQVACKKPEWTLHIYGEGSLRGSLQTMIDENGLSGSVFLEGNSENIMQEYQHSSVFVLSSYTEGFGMVLVEAASVGVPVVSFDCPSGPRNIIHDGQTGFLVEDGNIKKFADKLLMLMDDVNLRREMGRRAYEDSRQYLPEVVMKQWTELFEEMVRTK